jgi:trimeric autotransporter adhesin
MKSTLNAKPIGACRMSLVKKLLLGSIVLLVSVAVNAQNNAASATAMVPRLVNFSGKATDQGKPVAGMVGITFSIYSAQENGAPLWIETQNVQPDAKGNYTVQLGAATSEGLPLSLFSSGEARWLGVRVNSGEEQPRILLLSVPYALKAADAQTLGGLPASAFALASPNVSTGAASTPPSAPAQGSAPPVGGGGLQNYIPIWADNNDDLGNSILYQTGSGSSAKIGVNITKPLFTLDVNGQELVRGLFEMATTNYANKTKGFNSNPLNLESSAFNSSTDTYTLNHFQWQAEPTGNDTTTPGATLNLLYGTDPNQPAETGLNIANSGQITFAKGQTFPGTGTITGITTASGSGLSGGGTSGNLSLTLVTNCAGSQVLQWNGSVWACSSAGSGTITGVTAGTDLTGGGTSGNVTLNVDTTKVPQLNAANTFTGNQTVNGNLSATGILTGTSFQIGSNLFDYGSFPNGNAFLGFGGNATMSGQFNTASGQFALSSNTIGSFNAASGNSALGTNTTGNDNTALGALALASNVSASDTTAVGFGALGNSNASGPNDAFGSGALFFNSAGVENVAVGYQALGSNVGDSVGDGSYNTAVGYQALYMNNNTSNVGGEAVLNVAIGTQALYSNTTGNSNTASGFQSLYSNTTGKLNTATGSNALVSNTTGGSNTASGLNALAGNTTGGNNTANGTDALYLNTTGGNNTGVGAFALFSNATGSNLTCIGYSCTASRDLINATAIGAHALVEQSNSLVLGSSGVNVGIGTTKPSNILTIARGAGHPVSDSWETYSSRRWKTNIHPLQNALSKVEQLRGVSYDLKDSGKHEIGVIAEEVGQVVPEVVSYEKNGKDASGVDYSRLTALLIEAVKQQQKQIARQQFQIRKLRQLVTTQQDGIVRLTRKLGTLQSSLRANPSPAELRASR